MTRLTKADEKRATEALAECAAATKHIDDPKELNEAVYKVLSKRLGDKPELLKRACEGYNSAKSVYRLGAATDDTRGDNFAIVDAPALAKRAAEEARGSFITKSASANGFNKAQFTVDKPSNHVMSKVASAPTGPTQPVQCMRKLSSAEVIGEVTSYLDDIRYSLRKVASEYKDIDKSIKNAESGFFDEMDKLDNSMRKEAAAILHANYGEVGDMLVSLYNSARPMNKVASYCKNKYKGTVSVPDDPIYNKAFAVLKAHVLTKEASEITRGFAESAMSVVRDIFDANLGIDKKAAAPALSSLVPSPTFGQDIFGKTILGTELIENVPKLSDSKQSSELEKEITTSTLMNALKRHSVKRAFMSTATDPTVARYPLHQVTAAFNAVLAELPVHMRDIPPSAFSALLKSRTIARLGRGGAASGSDVDQIQQIQQAYSKLRPEELAGVVSSGS